MSALSEELRAQTSLTIVRNLKILEEDADFVKATLYFKNDTNLRIALDKERNAYSFYWLNEENNLIIGWDNRPHHPEVATFPHHKHIGLPKSVKPSRETTLAQVLRFIEKQLQQ